jgi:hypothetical protein
MRPTFENSKFEGGHSEVRVEAKDSAVDAQSNFIRNIPNLVVNSTF